MLLHKEIQNLHIMHISYYEKVQSILQKNYITMFFVQIALNLKYLDI